MGWVEADRRKVAERSDVTALVSRSERVAAILDEPEMVSLHKLHHSVEVEGIAKGVRNHHGRRFLAQSIFQPRNVDVVGGNGDVDEYRDEAVLDDRVEGGGEARGDCDDLVARFE